MKGTTYEAASEEALERALFRTRAYAPWRALDPGRGASLEDRFAALPRTDKALIRAAFPDGLVPEGRDLKLGLALGEVELVSTSGTTDEQVTNLWNQRWWDFSDRESWSYNGNMSRVCTGDHREAILTSALNVGFLSDGPELAFDERRLDRLLFLNERSTPTLWTPKIIERMARELERFGAPVLEANPSYLARFARHAAQLGLQVHQPQVIVFTYENPSLVHLREIRRVFGAPMLSSYGTTETGYVLMECERGFHHLNSESCRVDFVPLAGGVPEIGSLRVTPFGNEWFSLLRFDPGDLVILDRSGLCPCGRKSEVLVSSMEGRTKCLTWTTEGRPVTQGELDRLLAAEVSLVTYQLIQEGEARYRLKVVLERDEGRGAPDRLRDALHGLYGTTAEIRIEASGELVPEASGKFLLAKGPPTEQGKPRWRS
jgi:phenylacetate-coenzyme A ligase PaaK-like adenylate-forming protein